MSWERFIINILSEFELEEELKKERSFIYISTPFCGTCQVAEKILYVVEKIMPKLELGMINANYFPKNMEKWKVESVPCLLVFEQGCIKEKVYAFHSVPFMYEFFEQHMSN